MNTALAARVAALEARQAIADLVHGYARSIRYDRPEDVPALFAPDGWFEIRDGHPSQSGFTVRSRLDGPDAILAYLLPGKGKPHPIPLIHNLIVDLDMACGLASATAVMEAQVFGTPHSVKGEYRDSFRQIDGNWLFASRIYTIFSSASSTKPYAG